MTPSVRNGARPEGWLCWYGRVFGLVLACLMASAKAAADCALEARPLESDQVGYRERSSRCEGLYVRKVAAGDRIAILGFHQHYPRYELGDLDEGALKVIVSGERDGDPVELRVVSLRPDHYYQMDTRAVGAEGTFQWSTDVLRHPEIRLRPDELAVLACKGSCQDDDPRIMPVSIAAPGAAAPEPDPELLVRPSPGTHEVYLTVADSNGHLMPGYEYVAQLYGPYDVELPFPIYLDGLPPGDYDVLIEAELRHGGFDGARATLTLTDDGS